jgi:DNA-binding winged helix-turn-helix (wHTH) protein
MSTTTNYSYAFGGFTLDPNERELVYLNERVALAGKDLDVLIYIVQNPKRLITTQELVKAVWGDEPKILARNITHHIAKVRKALDCDPRRPTFIETVAKKGYRFIADVSQTATPGPDRSSPESAAERYLITSHLFVPVYFGEKAYQSIQGSEKSSRWASYKEVASEDGILCVMPNGIAVWHLTRTSRFESISVLARWRRQAYSEILDGKHRLSEVSKQIVRNSEMTKGSMFPSKLSTTSYVFSAFVMESPRWTNTIRVKNALQLLACLTPLETKLKRRKEEEIALERRILEDGFSRSEMYEFGVPGGDLGFASWDSLSYFQFDERSPSLMEDLTEFEIAVQATWWFAKCIIDELTSMGKPSKQGFKKSVEELRDMLAALTMVGPTDTPSQRTMMEAVLKTSRVERIANQAIKRHEWK